MLPDRTQQRGWVFGWSIWWTHTLRAVWHATTHKLFAGARHCSLGPGQRIAHRVCCLGCFVCLATTAQA
eukprot:7581581-Alexandrium_andersonii.AAC.1